jgi:hypothetical protein
MLFGLVLPCRQATRDIPLKKDDANLLWLQSNGSGATGATAIRDGTTEPVVGKRHRLNLPVLFLGEAVAARRRWSAST